MSDPSAPPPHTPPRYCRTCGRARNPDGTCRCGEPETAAFVGDPLGWRCFACHAISPLFTSHCRACHALRA
mgnify:CR=1 FL=1